MALMLENVQMAPFQNFGVIITGERTSALPADFGGSGGGFAEIEGGGMSFVFVVELRGGLLPEGGGGEWSR
jgi:hypothetical protein